MKTTGSKWLRKRVMHVRSAAFLLGILYSAQPGIWAQDGEEADVFDLSPFEVSTSGDKGYYASNSISGSRIDVRIQDLPLTIEVITSEFIEDTGSTDLRESLRYSAGILLQSQNDAFSAQFDDPGAINNPEGASADKSKSSFKIRGFVTRNTLRNGFRRQHATDTVNIDRIEVVRGPSALLYGVGNFGGVVNYISKAPQDTFSGQFALGIGSYGWKRSSGDLTGPISKTLSYRLTMAYEERDDWTDLNNHDHWFVSPVLLWKPFAKTKITIDFEMGKAHDNALSFRSVRAPTMEGLSIYDTDRLETYGFLEFPGKDKRTFRWSGPDTFLNTESWNLNVQLQQAITEDLHLLVGYNRSETDFFLRDIFAGIVINPSSARAHPHMATIQAIQVVDGKSSDVVIDVPNAVLQYNWNGSEEAIHWDQFRMEANYKKRAFKQSSLMESEHSLLLGYSYERQETARTDYLNKDSPDKNDVLYKNPTDSSYIRFDEDGDGLPEMPFLPNELSGGISENTGIYLVYSGRFFKDRLFLIAGMREDTTTSRGAYYNTIPSLRGGTRFYEDSEVAKRTQQFGASYEIFDGVSVFALKSEGIEPNFGGLRDGAGVAMESTVADAREFGIKLNFLDGKVAATISKFKIRREELPFSYWWAPAPVRGNFRPEDDIIYRLDEVNPDVNPTNIFLQQALDEWNAAKAAGAVYPQASGNSTYTYLNASRPEGAAFLDAVVAALNAEFAKPLEEQRAPWVGYLYRGLDDPEVNTAAEDLAGNQSGQFYQAISDESSGWEAQIILTPNDNLQLVFNYSHVKRVVLDPGRFVEYPYEEGNWDRWAMWYWPDANWGLGGVQPEDVYPGGPTGLPNEDTSTWTGIGWGKGESMDDTPEHVISWWATYRFTGDVLDGLQLGLGGIWESKREYASAFTTAGQKKQNDSGTAIKAFTDPRLTLNGMIKYSWQFERGYEAYLQLNVDNILDDIDQYGFVYAPGRSWRLNFGITF